MIFYPRTRKTQACENGLAEVLLSAQILQIMACSTDCSQKIFSPSKFLSNNKIMSIKDNI